MSVRTKGVPEHSEYSRVMGFDHTNGHTVRLCPAVAPSVRSRAAGPNRMLFLILALLLTPNAIPISWPCCRDPEEESNPIVVSPVDGTAVLLSQVAALLCFFETYI